MGTTKVLFDGTIDFTDNITITSQIIAEFDLSSRYREKQTEREREGCVKLFLCHYIMVIKKNDSMDIGRTIVMYTERLGSLRLFIRAIRVIRAVRNIHTQSGAIFLQ